MPRYSTGPRSDDLGPARAARRFPFAVPMAIEVSTGFFRPAQRIDALLVDLSDGGAAIVAIPDSRLRIRKRYRVFIDDHAGIIEIRNIVETEDGERVRLGVVFRSLGLQLQELVSDSMYEARSQSSRLSDRPVTYNSHDPFAARLR